VALGDERRFASSEITDVGAHSSVRPNVRLKVALLVEARGAFFKWTLEGKLTSLQ
jgi:hypothetical protein